jgi:hypothetical protein
MGSRVRKSRRSIIDKELRSSLEKRSSEERLSEMLETVSLGVSLRDVPLEERRREANKPLYLARYE